MTAAQVSMSSRPKHSGHACRVADLDLVKGLVFDALGHRSWSAIYTFSQLSTEKQFRGRAMHNSGMAFFAERRGFCRGSIRVRREQTRIDSVGMGACVCP